MSPSKTPRRALLSAVLFLAVMAGNVRTAGAATDDWFFGKDTWIDSVQVNARFLGHLGTSNALNAPSGGIYLEGQYGLWWDHWAEAHVQVLKSMTSESFSGYGGGLRLNVLEFSKANALEFSGQTTAGMRCIETRRGVFSGALRSLLVYAIADYVHYSFPAPVNGAFYQTSQWAPQWGGGVQWGPNIRISGISRLYIDTGAMFARISGQSYVIPFAGIGVNL